MGNKGSSPTESRESENENESGAEKARLRAERGEREREREVSAFICLLGQVTLEQVVRATDYTLPDAVEQAISAVFGLHGLPVPPRKTIHTQEPDEPAKGDQPAHHLRVEMVAMSPQMIAISPCPAVLRRASDSPAVDSGDNWRGCL